MERFKKNLPRKMTDQMERQIGRMMRSMTAANMNLSPFASWEPAVDIYELDGLVVVIMDVAGVDPGRLNVYAESRKLTVSGERRLPFANLTCIHQLEIEYGPFERTVALPVAVDVSGTTSECRNGFLRVTLPVQRDRGRVEIKVG